MHEPRDAIEHVDGCERPTLASGVGYTCDCATVQSAAKVRLTAEQQVEKVRDLLAAHDGNAPPSAYETLRQIREVIGDD